MRIVPLTEALARRLLERRRRREERAERTAKKICADVRKRGDAALIEWSRRLDHFPLSRKDLWVKPAELQAARRAAGHEFLRAVEHAARNLRRVVLQQKPHSWTIRVEPGVHVGQIVRPLESVGCYVPGGRFSLVSTLLMAIIPAQVAGVRKIVVACPKPSQPLLAAAHLLGIRWIARAGGAQAIAALAYGTKTIPPVVKIVGPGNRFVTAAKKWVSNDCAVDLPAGPTELLILATGGNPRFLAADLLAQAEHDPDALSLLVTPSRSLAREVRAEMIEQVRTLPRRSPAREALARNGSILVARSMEDAVRFANRFAPEHLSLPDGSKWLAQLQAAGSVFLGPWSAQPLGDYVSGTNHVLPTGGWARSRGGLSAADFVKCISIQRISQTGFKRLARSAKTWADAEQLPAHRGAIEVRE